MALRALNAGSAAPAGSKVWIEDQIIRIIGSAMYGLVEKRNSAGEIVDPRQPRNHTLALSGLMQLARLKGFIVEKKQSLNAKVDMSRMSAADLKATLEGTLDQLAPGERQRILEIAAGAEEIE